MQGKSQRAPAVLALVAALLGLYFSYVSTSDYARHLDRQVHDLHCSFIPGVSGASGAESACRTAMYSPYSAIFRSSYWGGIPISLFAVGAFAFFVGFAAYAVASGPRLPRRAAQFLGLSGLTPLAASAVMFTISWLKLGAFCKTCVGIYIASALLGVAGVWLLAKAAGRSTPESAAAPADAAPGPAPSGVSPLVALGWLAGLGLCTLTPAVLYAKSLPEVDTYLSSCGTLKSPPDAKTSLRMAGPGAAQQATLFVDPLCPTCKAFHQRLAADGLLEKLDAKVVLFPLDNKCNWMLDRAVHPGACTVSRAVLCADAGAQGVLEWAYDNQDALLKAGKDGNEGTVRNMIRQRFPNLDACIDSKDSGLRLDRMLRVAVTNSLPVSTPQLFLDSKRLCDEDTDIGLAYTLNKLAPQLRTP